MLSLLDRKYLNNLARRAGGAIMTVFISENFKLDNKNINSSFIKAYKASCRIIIPALQEMFPSFPVIFQDENNNVINDQNYDSKIFWLINPLNGENIFLKREKDFTVNIALIKNGTPIWGVVYAPARDWLYYGGTIERSIKYVRGEHREFLPIEEIRIKKTITAVSNEKNKKNDENLILKYYNVTNTISIGGVLKLCLVAEGLADIYFFAGKSMEWDIAAAHALLLGSNCIIESRNLPLLYNKPDFTNNFGFTCLSSTLRNS